MCHSDFISLDKNELHFGIDAAITNSIFFSFLQLGDFWFRFTVGLVMLYKSPWTITVVGAII